MGEDGAQRSRRRGDALQDALYKAALAELAERGYGGLSMEGVAARAHTGKAALYRRWPAKHDLVLAALVHALPDPPEPSAEGPAEPVRAELLGLLTRTCAVFAGDSPLPVISLAADLLREPALRARFTEVIVAPRLRAIESLLARGVARGELDPVALGPLAARTGPALILQTVLHTGRPPAGEDLEAIVDTVLAAALREGAENEKERSE